MFELRRVVRSQRSAIRLHATGVIVARNRNKDNTHNYQSGYR